ncbi:MAG: radical SAM protein [Candidatus Atabeyarchaeum deiterrae]
MDPETLVSLAKRSHSNGTSFSFNEPSTSLFEYSLDVMRRAKEKGLYNTYVTNLYSTLEALRLIVNSGCDAFCVNVKGDAIAVRKYCGVDAEIVWRNLRELKKYGKHIEVVTLVIPTVNDKETILRLIASRMRNELGAEVPWHCTRYYAAHKALALGLSQQTPISSLERAREIGLEEGLRYVYLGNVPGHPGENTYCPICNNLLIERSGLSIAYCAIDQIDNTCPDCHYRIGIRGKCLQGNAVSLNNPRNHQGRI